jgi:hypothetical protein
MNHVVWPLKIVIYFCSESPKLVGPRLLHTTRSFHQQPGCPSNLVPLDAGALQYRPPVSAAQDSDMAIPESQWASLLVFFLIDKMLVVAVVVTATVPAG